MIVAFVYRVHQMTKYNANSFDIMRNQLYQVD